MYNHRPRLSKGLLGEAHKKEAIWWFQKAADSDDEETLFQYDFRLENGVLLEMNKSEATSWHKKAADLRNASAM
jgi:TPR repeat protein